MFSAVAKLCRAPRQSRQWPAIFQAAILLLALPSLSLAQPTNLAELPPAAPVKINFDRDIRPIFQETCWRCHGAVKPRSDFRLTSRKDALEGGNDNVHDIIPGDGAGSHLIHYVAGLVPDMRMPPPKFGKPLTRQEVSLLRAWIDQGAYWSTSNQFPQSAFAVSPTLRWIGVQGNAAKFRELEGEPQGWGGGAQNFSFEQQQSAVTKLKVQGHVLMPEQDVDLKLDWTKADLGFVRAGFDHGRKYYNDVGGYAPNLPAHSFSLDRDLHLDYGRAWVDFGWAAPRRPAVTLGYEYQFRQGDEATLQWGAVGTAPNANPALSSADTKHVFPAAKHIDEDTHIVKLDVSYEPAGWRLEDNARVEFYHLATSRSNVLAYSLGPAPNSGARVNEGESHTQGENTFSVGKQLKDWLSVYGGYYYSRLDGSASLNENTLDASGNPVLGEQWSAGDIALNRESQVFSVGDLLGPWKGAALSSGVQADWTRQESSGLEQLLYGTPAAPNPLALSSTNNVVGRLDSASVRENFSLRYTAVPFTVLFAEARLRQESLRRDAAGYVQGFSSFGAFTNRSDADVMSGEYRAGFYTSPWAPVSLGASFIRLDKHTGYSGTNSLIADYPGFLQWRDIAENQVQTRLSWRVTSWLRSSLNYRWQKTDFRSAAFQVPGFTGGAIEAARQELDLYSLDAVLTPFRRLVLSSTFSYTDSRIVTAYDGSAGLVPWRGDNFSVLSGATFAWSAATSLNATYDYSLAAYAQNNPATGLPAGIDYERHRLQFGIRRRFSKTVTAALTYAFYQYREPTAGGANDFTANAVLVTVAMAWP